MYWPLFGKLIFERKHYENEREEFQCACARVCLLCICEFIHHLKEIVIWFIPTKKKNFPLKKTLRMKNDFLSKQYLLIRPKRCFLCEIYIYLTFLFSSIATARTFRHHSLCTLRSHSGFLPLVSLFIFLYEINCRNERF